MVKFGNRRITSGDSIHLQDHRKLCYKRKEMGFINGGGIKLSAGFRDWLIKKNNETKVRNR